MLCCPVCRRPIESDGRSLRCQNGHCFDLSKRGYVNLLTAEAMRSKSPGDNRLMVEARRSFLEKGFYRPLSDAVNRAAAEALAGIERPVILDAGCGEGYYTARLCEALPFSEIVGMDISKTAVDKAARLTKGVTWVVASVFHTPMADGCCDLVLNLFAPYCGDEYRRLLKPNGRLIMAIPAAEHLWELKQAVYERPYKNEVKDYSLDGFALEARREVDYMMNLLSQEDIDSLFKMTPYYYKTGAADQQRLTAYQRLDVRASFELLIYKNKD